MVARRILHVFSTFDHGGAEARTVRLMQHFGDEAQHEVLVPVRSAMGACKAIGPEITASFPEDPARLVLGRPGLRRYWRLAQHMRGFDLVLTYSWGAMDAVMAHRLFARLLRLPRLVHHEDGFNEDEVGARFGLRDGFRRIALQGAAALVIPSRTLETVARQRWHVPGSKLARISNGIDTAAYRKAPQIGALPGLVRREGEVVVGTVAGLRAVKNLSRLVRAVAAAGPNIRLFIAGEGPDRAAIEAEARRLGVADRVHLPGFLPDPARYIGHFDIFALSSDSEQFPIALAEAMAAGLPVVSTDVGDVAAMIAASGREFVVPRGDEAALSAAVARLAADPALRARLGADNAELAQSAFDEAAMFAEYRRIYGIDPKTAD